MRECLKVSLLRLSKQSVSMFNWSLCVQANYAIIVHKPCRRTWWVCRTWIHIDILFVILVGCVLSCIVFTIVIAFLVCIVITDHIIINQR